MKEKKYYLLHSACGQTAFFFTKKPEYGDPVSAETIIKIDGTQPIPGEDIVCGSCGESLSGSDLNIDNILPIS